MDEVFFEELKRRRDNLCSLLGDDELFIILSNQLFLRTKDVYYPFSQERTFYYFTGFCEPDSCVIIGKGVYEIFLRGKDSIREMWEGKSLVIDDAYDELGVFKAYSFNSLEEVISKKFSSYKVNFVCQENHRLKNSLLKLFSALSLEIVSKKRTEHILFCLRREKSFYEREQIRKACEISSKAHNKILSFQGKDSITEKNLANYFSFYLREEGGDFEFPYPPIVAGGKNSLCLHYIKNNQTIKKGELVLIDAACSYNFYSADISRTFPISGKFSPAQKIAYEIVLKVLEELSLFLSFDVSFFDCHKKSVEVMVDLLLNADIFTKKLSKEEIIAKKLYKSFFPHSIGHYLGLDTHDISDYNTKLVKNVTLTLEPGLYFRKDNALVKKEFTNIGIRIEDNFLLSDSGVENLTEKAIKNYF